MTTTNQEDTMTHSTYRFILTETRDGWTISVGSEVIDSYLDSVESCKSRIASRLSAWGESDASVEYEIRNDL